eukprot:jgi/Mesvir1/16791/Mv15161-RA.1
MCEPFPALVYKRLTTSILWSPRQRNAPAVPDVVRKIEASFNFQQCACIKSKYLEPESFDAQKKAEISRLFPPWLADAGMCKYPFYDGISNASGAPPPFGSDGVGDEELQGIVTSSSHHMPPPFKRRETTRSQPCRHTCALVGSSAKLLYYKLGKEIDGHDIILRMNDAPLRGFFDHVGSRTTLRLFYPESYAPLADVVKETPEPPSVPGGKQRTRLHGKPGMFVMVSFKPVDTQWLSAVMTGNRQRLAEIRKAFWKRTRPFPDNAGPFALVHPYLFRLLRDDWLGNSSAPTWPSTGLIAGAIAMLMCETLHIYGMSTREDTHRKGYTHYYYSEPDKGLVLTHNELRKHDMAAELELWEQLIALGLATRMDVRKRGTS